MSCANGDESVTAKRTPECRVREDDLVRPAGFKLAGAGENPRTEHSFKFGYGDELITDQEGGTFPEGSLELQRQPIWFGVSSHHGSVPHPLTLLG
jgi:hypothetical protein